MDALAAGIYHHDCNRARMRYVGCRLVLRALCLTHERATPEEVVPYLTHAFHPLLILHLFGRASVDQPSCLKEHCVWYAWRDRDVQQCIYVHVCARSHAMRHACLPARSLHIEAVSLLPCR